MMDFIKNEYKIKYTFSIELSPSSEEINANKIFTYNLFKHKKEYIKPIADNLFILISVSL